jgi:hypothetical protein
VRLTDAYTPSPWTLPSHVSLMTGLTPMAHLAVTPNEPRARAALEAFRTCYRDLRTRGRALQRSHVDEAMRSTLEGLGYLVTLRRGTAVPARAAVRVALLHAGGRRRSRQRIAGMCWLELAPMCY